MSGFSSSAAGGDAAASLRLQPNDRLLCSLNDVASLEESGLRVDKLFSVRILQQSFYYYLFMP